MVDRAWREFDTKKSGVLDKIEAFALVNKVLRKHKGENNYNVGDFDQWFERNDTSQAATLEKALIMDYIRSTA